MSHHPEKAQLQCKFKEEADIMGKIYTIEEIRDKVKPIAERYGIDTVWLFGFYACSEATENCDVD